MPTVLALDDMGAERSTPFAEDKLFQIINYRYEERLPTIITTSHLIEEIAAEPVRASHPDLQDPLAVKESAHCRRRITGRAASCHLPAPPQP